MNKSILICLVACLGLLLGAPLAFAAGAGEAKARMRERVATVDELKKAEAIGENNRGFLEVRKAGGNAQAVVDAENRDRAEVFKDAAARAGGSADEVGRSFARQIAAASKPGVWLQKEDGSWFKK